MVFHQLLHGKRDVERGKPASLHDAEMAYYACDGMSALVYDAVEEHLLARGTSACLGDEAYYLDRAARLGGPVLEVGAGTGRLSWALAEAGHHVIGVDVAPAMLRQAEAKREFQPAEVAIRARFILEDLRRLELDRRFGLIIAPYRTINLLTSAEDQRHALSTLARHLAPNGEMILHMLAPEFRDWVKVMDEPPRADPRAHGRRRASCGDAAGAARHRRRLPAQQRDHRIHHHGVRRRHPAP